MSLAPAETFLAGVRALGAIAATHVDAPFTGDAHAVFADVEGVRLHEDVIALWQTFNGTVQNDAPLGKLWLDGTFFYLGAEDSREDYRISEPMWLEDPTFAEYMPPRFIAVGSPGDGSRLMVNCDTASPTYGAVYELFHGIGVRKRSMSLARHFETLIAQLDTGALTCTQDGEMNMDFEAEKIMGQKLNPGCNHWDYTLPTCQDAPDWRTESTAP